MKKMIAAALLAAVCIGAVAQTTKQPQKSFVVLGVGNCVDWGKREPILQGWVLGYVSGMNGVRVNTGRNDMLDGMNGAQLVAWMDNYCAGHPLDDVPAAANALVDELSRRK